MSQEKEKVEAELVLEARTDLGESPIALAGPRLGFVDINEKRIHVLELETKEHFTVDLPEQVGCIVPTADDPDRLLAFLHRSVVEVNLRERRVGRTLAEVPESHGTADWRFNDGKATPGGVVLAGRMHAKWRELEPSGRLYRLDLQPGGRGEFVEILGGIGLTNGLAWDEGLRIMYFVDSRRASITAYPTDGQGLPLLGLEGTLEGQGKVVVQLAAGEQVPDGMTIDTDGNLWVALHGDGAIACFDPRTGREARPRVRVPAKRVTAGTFAGRDLGTLYITTRVESGEGAAEHWGGIFGAKVPGVRGVAPAYPAKLP